MTNNRIDSAEMNFCPFCGEELDSVDFFCPFCGERLKEDDDLQTIHEGFAAQRQLFGIASGAFTPGLELEGSFDIDSFDSSNSYCRLPYDKIYDLFKRQADLLKNMTDRFPEEKVYRDIYSEAQALISSIAHNKKDYLNKKEQNYATSILLFLGACRASLKSSHKNFSNDLKIIESDIKAIRRLCPCNKTAIEKYLGKEEPEVVRENENVSDYSPDVKGDIVNLRKELNEMPPSFKRHIFDENENYWSELDSLIGLEKVKTQLRNVIDNHKIQLKRKEIHPELQVQTTFHCVFKGRPGTGKTTVARLVAGILKEEKILNRGCCVEVNASDLISGYIGFSAKLAKLALLEAMDGVLFIDEAYALSNNKGEKANLGAEVVDTLTPLMENYRDRLVVIIAGYDDEMDKFLSKSNTGFPSRFKYIIQFDDYDGKEMYDIFLGLVRKNMYFLDKAAEDKAKQLFQYIDSKKKEIKTFANARSVRSIFDMVKQRASQRMLNENNPNWDKLTKEDLSLTKEELDIALGITDKNILPSQEQGKSIKPLRKLRRFDELEESTKSKIGTFEKMYEKTYSEETGRHLVFGGYDTLDFAPLINPLASALEIELTLSVYRPIRSAYGKKIIDTKYKKVDLSNKTPSIRDSQSCIDYDINHDKILERLGLSNAIACVRDINPIISTRNEASHTGKVEKEKFFEFYNYVYNFFENHLAALLEVKKNFNNQPEKHISSSMQTDESYKDSYIETEQTKEKERISKQGIIFTDTAKIAIKLFGSETMDTPEGKEVKTADIVKGILCEYSAEMSKRGVEYRIFDYSIKNSTGNVSWETYADALLNFDRERLSANGEIYPIGLFIVGGHDVIPMPQVSNPFYLNENKGKDMFERVLESDMLYACYDGSTTLIDKDGNVNYEALLKASPRYWVGRLPMENGQVDAPNGIHPFDEFAGYFKRALAEYDSSGILINDHVATSCQSTISVAKNMLDGIPLSPLSDKGDYISDNMFLSPTLDATVADKKMDDYVPVVSEADMLTFILHGADKASCCHYYGENRDKTQTTIAFTTELMRISKAKVISAISCWGARFVGFSRVQSLLLSAIYSNTLLFVGACRSARGVFDIYMEKYNIGIMLAELLVKYYMNNLLRGKSAGEALELAKRYYLSHPDVATNDVLATVLEFNLFGDPMLSLRPILQDKNPIEVDNTNISKMSFAASDTYKKEYDKDEKGLSLLEMVRRKVDKNFDEIRRRVSEQLYKEISLDPRDLCSVYSYNIDKTEAGERGYRFSYNSPSEYFSRTTIVDTDEKGVVKRIIGSL